MSVTRRDEVLDFVQIHVRSPTRRRALRLACKLDALVVKKINLMDSQH